MTSVTMPTLFNKACWKNLDSLAKKKKREKKKHTKKTSVSVKGELSLHSLVQLVIITGNYFLKMREEINYNSNVNV